MSAFSVSWLALREGADHRARNISVRNAMVAAFRSYDFLRIVDLACGSGSNLRALAPFLSRRQRWSLVDSDRLLLTEAQDALLSWSDDVLNREPLVLQKSGKKIEVEFLQEDLAANISKTFDRAGDLDLVTSAAFFDLVSETWIEKFCDELSRRKLPVNATMTYSGEEIWHPAHAADHAVLEYLHLHQMRDKGFGPAVGPHGARVLRSALEASGYRVVAGPSPWRLGPEDCFLIEALAEGTADAVSLIESAPPALVSAWRSSRRRAKACEIGHVDLFASRISGQ